MIHPNGATRPMGAQCACARLGLLADGAERG